LHGGRIIKLSVKAGEHVNSGEEIVVLKTDEVCEIKSDKAQRKIKQSIALNKQRLQALNSRREKTAARKQLLLDKRRLGRVLELERRQQSEVRALERTMDELEIEIEILKQEIDLQKRELELLGNAGGVTEECGIERITVPISGQVATINQHLYEVVNRKDTILTLIPERPKVWVEAFSKADDHLPLEMRQSVNVRLPGGRLTKGELDTVKAAAYPFPEKKYDDYTPKESGLRLTIKPINHDTAKQWVEFDRRAVSVEGKR
jgi:multidrug efflux pump subunit AcrA (membrane-fusion protein)